MMAQPSVIVEQDASWTITADHVEGSSFASESASSTVPHICIVGAGIAGLRCAEILLTHGIKVTILEARNRIGGRIHQSNVLGYPADVGPNWIHTSGNNPLLPIASDSNTPLHTWNGKMLVFGTDGIPISDEKATELSELRWRIITESIETSRQNGSQIPESESLYDFFVKKASELSLSNEDRNILLEMSKMWGCYVGEAVDRQSLKYMWLEEVCIGDECFIGSTYSGILDKVASAALSSACIQFDKKVIGCQFRQRPNGGADVGITLLDGTQQAYDGAVLTTPLGWLKSSKDIFHPPLEEILLNAIDAISVGHLEKVYIKFPEAFWRGSESQRSGPRTQEDDDSSPMEELPTYMNWLSPTYAHSTNRQHWPQEAFDLAALAEPNSHPALLFYVYGDCSAHISSLAHNLSGAEQRAALDAFFRPYYSLLPHFSENSEECKPVAILATDWRYDDLAGNGSYCYFQIGLTDADKHLEAMRRGSPDRGLWLAGEHTAPIEEMGTASGAYLAGQQVAKAVVEKYLTQKGEKQGMVN